MAQPKSYPLSQSPLFRLTSKAKLAKLLKLSTRDLKFLVSLEDANYQMWPLEQKRRYRVAGLPPPTKVRIIQQPMPLLRDLHNRLALLLGRITKPDFVYSATKGRSYLDNAKQHMNSHAAFKVDIKDFYPSITLKMVQRFFAEDLECPPDIAHFLAKLCCVKGVLPTGSAISPVLSYFACAPLFGWMSDLAVRNDLKFSLYIDDMFFSGKKATVDMRRLVVNKLKSYNLKGHKVSHFAPGQTKIITGVAITETSISIPFKRQKRIRIFEEAFGRMNDPENLMLLGKTLLGQYREGERLQQGSRDRARPIQDRMDAVASALFAPLTAVPPKRKRQSTALKSAESKAKQLAQLRASKANAVPAPAVEQPELPTTI